jgi:hypothetical protein
MNNTKEGTERINPQITDFTIGVRNLRNIVIYPLSIFDEKKMAKQIAKGLEKFFSLEGSDDNAKTVQIIVELVEENLVDILSIITQGEEKGEELIKEITNDQAGDLALLIYNVNYEGLIKKVKSLLEKIGILDYQSGRSSQPFVNDMDTSPIRSSTEDLKKEA